MRKISRGLFLIWAVLSVPSGANGQGSLTPPPGAPGPTMKTLGQIEPRVAISTIPFIITSPGSYYLTTNLTGVSAADGISIQSDRVTLDLNGFSLVGAAGSLKGIVVGGARKGINIHNGSLSQWKVGVDAESASNSRFEGLNISDNADTGLVAGMSCLIANCTSSANEGFGFRLERDSAIQNCTARDNFAGGIKAGAGAQVTGCIASYNGDGIVSDSGVMISGCSVANNTGAGVLGGMGNHLTSVNAVSNGGHGIQSSTNSILTQCAASFNSGHGILASDVSQLINCRSTQNKLNGILVGLDSIISGSTGSQNTEEGIVTGDYSRVSESSAQGNGRRGIVVGLGSLVRNCNTQRNGGAGITVTSECTVVGNQSDHNFNIISAAGIHATGTDNTIKDNNVISNDRGISLDKAGNLVVRNTASNNTINYFYVEGQSIGPVFKGDLNNATSPWTNFEF